MQVKYNKCLKYQINIFHIKCYVQVLTYEIQKSISIMTIPCHLKWMFQKYKKVFGNQTYLFIVIMKHLTEKSILVEYAVII